MLSILCRSLAFVKGMRHCEELLRRSNPAVPRDFWIALPRSQSRGGSLQRRQQSRHQPAALGEAVDLDVLVQGMRAVAAHAEAVERRNAHGAGEIAVGTAAGAAMRELQ